MTDYLVATLLIVGVTFSYITFVLVIPSFGKSLYRYRLWRLRDELMDEIIHDRLPDNMITRCVVSRIEVAIEGSNRHSFFSIVCNGMFPRKVGNISQLLMDDVNELQKLKRQQSPGVLAILAKYEDRLDSLSREWALLASPSGLSLIAPIMSIVLPIALIFALFKRLKMSLSPVSWETHTVTIIRTNVIENMMTHVPTPAKDDVPVGNNSSRRRHLASLAS